MGKILSKPRVYKAEDYRIAEKIADQITKQKNPVRFDSKIYNSNCPRCNGSNFLPQFVHYKNGVCFLCGREKKYY